MGNSILTAMLDTGVVSESDMLFTLHKTGKVDVPQWIKETVANIKLEVAGLTNVEAVAKLRETATYLETMASIIEDIDNDTAKGDDSSPTKISVVGSDL